MKKTAFALLLLLAITLTPAAIADEVDSVTIEAYIDGPSALYIRPKTIYWENGQNAKPGQWNFADEPTYVNGDAWKPRWKKKDQERGGDTSNYYSISLGDPANLEFTLLAVTKEKGGAGIEKRSPVTARMTTKGEMIITIPDDQNEARWYKFTVSKIKK